MVIIGPDRRMFTWFFRIVLVALYVSLVATKKVKEDLKRHEVKTWEHILVYKRPEETATNEPIINPRIVNKETVRNSMSTYSTEKTMEDDLIQNYRRRKHSSVSKETIRNAMSTDSIETTMEDDLVQNYGRRQHSSVQKIREKLVEMLPKDVIEVDQVQGTAFARLYKIFIRNWYIILGCILATYFISMYCCDSDPMYFYKQLPNFSSPAPGQTSPMKSPQTSTKDQIPLVKPRTEDRHPPSTTTPSSPPGQPHIRVPVSGDKLVVTTRDMFPVREKVKSQVHNKAEIIETLKLLNVHCPSGADLFFPNFIQKGFGHSIQTFEVDNGEGGDEKVEDNVREQIRQFAIRNRKFTK